MRSPHDHPHHDTHGGSVIDPTDDADALAQSDHDRRTIAHKPADVTVADILDAYDWRTTTGRPVFPDLPPIDVIASADRVYRTLTDYRALSPEERAEFEARTRQNG